MKSNGDFVLYNINKKAVWSTETKNNPGSHIIAQDDGNVVVYTASKRPIWSTGTYGYTCPGMEIGHFYDFQSPELNVNGSYQAVNLNYPFQQSKISGLQLNFSKKVVF